jgi:hypothetical protein
VLAGYSDSFGWEVRVTILLPDSLSRSENMA